MEWLNIIQAVTTILIGYFIANYLSKYLRKGLKSKTAKELFKKQYNESIIDYGIYYLKLLIYITTFLLAVASLGFAQEIMIIISIILISSVIGVMIYSLRDFIPNAFAGYYIKNNNLIRKGELIEIKNFKGKVKKVDLLTTMIEDGKGKRIIIPNNFITKYLIKK